MANGLAEQLHMTFASTYGKVKVYILYDIKNGAGT